MYNMSDVVIYYGMKMWGVILDQEIKCDGYFLRLFSLALAATFLYLPFTSAIVRFFAFFAKAMLTAAMLGAVAFFLGCVNWLTMPFSICFSASILKKVVMNG